MTSNTNIQLSKVHNNYTQVICEAELNYFQYS